MGWIAIVALAVALAAACAWVVALLLDGRRTRRRFDILGQVAAVSDGAGSLEETFEAICDILVPIFADVCAIVGGEATRSSDLTGCPTASSMRRT